MPPRGPRRRVAQAIGAVRDLTHPGAATGADQRPRVGAEAGRRARRHPCGVAALAQGVPLELGGLEVPLGELPDGLELLLLLDEALPEP